MGNVPITSFAVKGDPGTLSAQEAESILANATASSAIPVALPIAEQVVVGRITGGHVVGLTKAQLLTLINVEDGANNYVHPTTNGNKHIPSTGSSTQILQYSAAGTAKWISISGDAFIADDGAVTITNVVLGENSGIAIDPAGSADEKWSGITVTGTAGATLAVGDLCYLNSSFKWVLTDANAAASAGSVALGLCILAAAGDTAATAMLLVGTMRSAAFPASITGGVQLYVSTTAGDMTTTQPTGVDDVIRVVGWAIITEPNTIYFNPSSDFITRTA